MNNGTSNKEEVNNEGKVNPQSTEEFLDKMAEKFAEVFIADAESNKPKENEK